jgi:hypothetical protein
MDILARVGSAIQVDPDPFQVVYRDAGMWCLARRTCMFCAEASPVATQHSHPTQREDVWSAIGLLSNCDEVSPARQRTAKTSL